MSSKANGAYTDGMTDSLKHSGVQPWSAGESFPYVVYMHEWRTPAGALISTDYVVSLAGEPLDECDSWDAAEKRALQFKQHGIKTKQDVQWFDNEHAMLGAEALIGGETAALMSELRERNDKRVMYGDPEHVSASMGDPGWQAQRDAEAREYNLQQRRRAAEHFGTDDNGGIMGDMPNVPDDIQ